MSAFMTIFTELSSMRREKWVPVCVIWWNGCVGTQTGDHKVKVAGHNQFDRGTVR